MGLQIESDVVFYWSYSYLLLYIFRLSWITFIFLIYVLTLVYFLSFLVHFLIFIILLAFFTRPNKLYWL